jgi:CRP-like cAMP-binding protein
MKLKNEKPKMEIVPMNDNTLNRLLHILTKRKKLDENFGAYLQRVMVAKYCLETHDMWELGKVITSAYYISYGFILVYYYNANGKLCVWKLFKAGDIVAGNSFLNEEGCLYHMKIFKGTNILEITIDQMKTGYATVPGMLELTKRTVASFEKRDFYQFEALRRGGKACVLHLYKENPGLLPPGSLISDAFLASLLNMSEDNLQRLRAILISEGELPNKRG